MNATTLPGSLTDSLVGLQPRVAVLGVESALFASDMHLGEHDPATAQRFCALLQQVAAQTSHVFLLGDLFEVWVGDDQSDPVTRQVLAAFRALTAGGKMLYIMRGNRDFLIDAAGSPAPRSLTAQCGAHLLIDPCVIDLFGLRVLLLHGDTLCVDDTAYQQFRAQTRAPAWQANFLAMPLAERLKVARQLRERSEHEKQIKAGYLMDVNDAEVIRVMSDAAVATLIHGHTHRPAQHRLEIDGLPAVRWVLPDWDAAVPRGGFLRVDRSGWTRIGDW